MKVKQFVLMFRLNLSRRYWSISYPFHNSCAVSSLCLWIKRPYLSTLLAFLTSTRCLRWAVSDKGSSYELLEWCSFPFTIREWRLISLCFCFSEVISEEESIWGIESLSYKVWRSEGFKNLRLGLRVVGKPFARLAWNFFCNAVCLKGDNKIYPILALTITSELAKVLGS